MNPLSCTEMIREEGKKRNENSPLVWLPEEMGVHLSLKEKGVEEKEGRPRPLRAVHLKRTARRFKRSLRRSGKECGTKSTKSMMLSVLTEVGGKGRFKNLGDEERETTSALA